MIGSLEVAGFLKWVYSSFDMNSFRNRLKLQKIVYLIQVFGINLGYSFSWYLYGPYSTDLTRTGFQITNFDKVKLIEFTDPEQGALFDRFHRFVEPHKDDIKWLEIASSLIFLKKLNQDKTKENIILEIQSKQDYFNNDKELILTIWVQLERDGLLNG